MADLTTDKHQVADEIASDLGYRSHCSEIGDFNEGIKVHLNGSGSEEIKNLSNKLDEYGYQIVVIGWGTDCVIAERLH